MKKATPVHIVSMEVQNFRRLTAAEVTILPGKGLVRVTGPNSSGKTSLLKAIAGALGGGGEVHRESLREGAKTGMVSLKLSNGFTIERQFTENHPKGYLKVKGPDDGLHAQGKLTGWIGDRSFDPLAFFSLSPGDKRDALFSVAKDPDLPDKLTNLRELQKETYDSRTPWIVQKRELNKILESPPEGEAPEPVDTKETLRKLQVLQVERETYESEKGKCRDAVQAKNDLFAAVEEHERRAAELTRELEAEEESLRDAQARFADVEKFNAELIKAFNKREDPQPAILDAQMTLASATEVLKAREPWERHAKATTEAVEVDKTEKEITATLKGLRDREAQLLNEAGIPVDGIGFDDQGLPQLNGRSLEVASGRERIEVAVAVALAADPEIRVCLVDEANDLDLDALKALDKLAKRHGFQIWVVRIGLEGAGEIVVEDGVAKDRKEGM